MWIKEIKKKFPDINIYPTDSYYSGSTKYCPLKRKMCHEGNGNIGYICEFWKGFECGDNPNKVFCSYEKDDYDHDFLESFGVCI